MKDLIKTVKDFKIIPSNFKSAATFDLIEAFEDSIKIKLNLCDENEINDYETGTSVEVFGVNNVGLIYFETKILKVNPAEKTAKLALVEDYSIIQRREYSRVDFNNGSVIFKDLDENFVKKTDDISAGGLKFTASYPLEPDKQYDITINLSANMKIECGFCPIRVTENKEEKNFSISGKFVDLENMDRIVLVQYAFKIKMEKQNKDNDL